MASDETKTKEPENKQWCRDDFVIGKKLASGKFARVYIARIKRTDYLVALKVLTKHGIIQDGMEHYLRAEIRILSNCR